MFIAPRYKSTIMKTVSTRFAKLAAFAAALSCLPAVSAAEDGPQQDRGEVELAKILEGRVAGQPVKCLRQSQRDRLQVISGTALVFRDGKTIYVNRTSSPRFISNFDLPVFKPFGSNLCQLDQVEFRDRTMLMPGPVVTLTEFIPYTEAEDADNGD